MEPRPVDTSTPPMGGGTDAGVTTGAGGGDLSRDPAEGRPDLGIPGADRDDVPTLPQGRDDDLPERLGERIENGSSSGMATGEPDVLPDVEVPDATM